MPVVLDYILGGWQYTSAVRAYSGRPVLFKRAAVSGNPTLDIPTRDRWFDTSMFAAQPAFTPRTNPVFYDGLNGPGAWFVDMTLTKSFPIGPLSPRGARRGLQRVQPHRLGSAGHDVRRARTSARSRASASTATGREIQVGLRFVF